jgi:hypothetical protein
LHPCIPVRGVEGALLDSGLAKRTVLAAWLADTSTATPKKAVGVMSMDPGLSTQLFDLYHSVCDASFVAYTSFIIQIIGSLYGIVTVSIIWADDASLMQQPYGIQLQQQLAALTINRGMWSIAALGAFFPWAPLHALYLTTAVAVALEFLFAARGFLIGWHMSLLPGILRFFVVFSWLLPSAEALTLIFGMFLHFSFINPAFTHISYRHYRNEDGGFIHIRQSDHLRDPGTVVNNRAVAHHRGLVGIALWHAELSCCQF